MSCGPWAILNGSLNNPATEKLLEKEARLGKEIKFEDILEEVVGVYPRVMTEGQVDTGVWSCGMVAGLINDIPTCSQLIDRIMSESEKIIRDRLTTMLAG